jgi:DNA replication and repair protein RecF
VSTVGPHRDELELFLNGMPVRTTGSQGECRTLALALRLGVHRLVTEKVGEAPLLVLDDVLSELDPGRSTALLGHLPPGQVIITTAQPLPPAAAPDTVVQIRAGAVVGITSGEAP